MDITGGTQSSGGIWSPSPVRKAGVVYDPRFHRWQQPQTFQTLASRTLSVTNTIANERYQSVSP